MKSTQTETQDSVSLAPSVEQQVQAAYRHLYRQFFSQRPALRSSYQQIAAQLLQKLDPSKLRDRLLAPTQSSPTDAETRPKPRRCIKHSRKQPARVSKEQQHRFSHSFIITTNKEQQLCVLILGQAPDKHSALCAKGAFKSFKPALFVQNLYTSNLRASSVLLEICNRSRHGLRTTLSKQTYLEPQAASTLSFFRKTKERRPILYRVHPSTHLKFDLVSLCTQWMQSDDQNGMTPGSAKLFFLLRQMAQQLHRFHEEQQRPHGDVKLENYLVNQRGEIEISDEAPLKPLQTLTTHITFCLLPPEPCRPNRRRCAADTFALTFSLLKVVFHFVLLHPSLNASPERVKILKMLQMLHSNQMRLPPSQMKPTPEAIRLMSGFNRGYIARLVPILKSFIPTVTQHDPALNSLMQLLYQTLEIDPENRIKLSDLLPQLESIPPQKNSTPALSQPETSSLKRTQPEEASASSSPNKKAKLSQPSLFKKSPIAVPLEQKKPATAARFNRRHGSI